MALRLLGGAVPRRSLPPDDDRVLLARFAEIGDEAAFAALVGRHGPLVLGVCRRMLRDSHAADDAFQAVFLVLARKASSVQVGSSLANWLFGVSRRVAMAARRRSRRMRNAERSVRNESPTSDTETRAAQFDDLLLTLDEELARLPDRLRAPVLECFFREKTQDEAAKSLGWSLSTVRRRLERAKELLRSRLTARGATLPAVLAAVGVAAARMSPTLAQAAVGVAMTARSGGAIAAGISTLAQGGIGMSMMTKVGLGGVAAGLLAVGGAGLALGWFSPSNPVPTVPTPVPNPLPLPTDKRGIGPLKVAPCLPPRVDFLVPPTPPTRIAGPVEWVTLRGQVKMSKPPAPRPVDVTTDKEQCTKDGPLVYEDVVVSKTGGVKYVIVWLRPDSMERKEPFPADRIHPDLKNTKPVNRVIDQPCCQFEPRVLAARTGDTLEFKNSSKVPHNTNYSSDNEPSNYTLQPGTTHSHPLVAQSTPIPFKCDIHPWMAGRLRVFDHPYFAVTDAEGNFEIKNVPAGKWRIVYWHENGFHKGREGVLGFPVEARSEVVELPALELELPKP